MRGKPTYIRPSNNKKVAFYSLFEETVPHVSFLWHPVEPSAMPEYQLNVFSGINLLTIIKL